MGKLTQNGIKAALAKPGRYRDGDGLMLVVSKPGVASWVARFQHEGRRRDFGLGSIKSVSLAKSRDKARRIKSALVEGSDPHAIDTPLPGMQRLFRDTALEFVDRKFSGAGHKQAMARLKSYVFPCLGKLQLQSIDAERIANCIEPIWQTKPETALRVRGLIIRTLRYGRPDGPALAGTLARAVSDMLPSQQNTSEGFATMPWVELPTFMQRLKDKPGMGALALQAVILTAARSGEIRGATWSEVDFEKAVWTIPRERMKTNKLHRVPLSPPAIAVFKKAAALRPAGTMVVFPNRTGEKLSDMTLLKCLRDMGESATVHGLRSTFRDFVAEELLEWPDEIAEAALSHVVPDKVIAAYKRTTFFELRRDLMTIWGRFVEGDDSAEVINFSRARDRR